MRSLVKAALVAALVGTPLATVADEEGDIKYRQAVMKSVAGHAGAIAQIAKGKVRHADALKGHTHALLELSKLVPAAFKNETMMESRSKSEVWSDWADFDGKAGDFERAAMAVNEAAKSGPGAVGGKLEALFDSCKGCHKKYREKKE